MIRESLASSVQKLGRDQGGMGWLKSIDPETEALVRKTMEVSWGDRTLRIKMCLGASVNHYECRIFKAHLPCRSPPYH